MKAISTALIMSLALLSLPAIASENGVSITQGVPSAVFLNDIPRVEVSVAPVAGVLAPASRRSRVSRLVPAAAEVFSSCEGLVSGLTRDTPAEKLLMNLIPVLIASSESEDWVLPEKVKELVEEWITSDRFQAQLGAYWSKEDHLHSIQKFQIRSPDVPVAPRVRLFGLVSLENNIELSLGRNAGGIWANQVSVVPGLGAGLKVYTPAGLEVTFRSGIGLGLAMFASNRNILTTDASLFSFTLQNIEVHY